MSPFVVTYSYPRGPAFDLSYYTSKHMPLAQRSWTPFMLSWSVTAFEEGPYQVVSYAYFESKETFEKAMSMLEARRTVLEDVKNFTEAEGKLEVGEEVARG